MLNFLSIYYNAFVSFPVYSLVNLVILTVFVETQLWFVMEMKFPFSAPIIVFRKVTLQPAQ